MASAVCAVFLYSFVSYCTVRLQSRLQAPLDVLTWLPLTIPGIVLSFGYLYMVLRVPVFRPFYGTMWVMVLVSVLAAMTLGVQILKVHMLQIGAEVEEAGRVAGGAWGQTVPPTIPPLPLPAHDKGHWPVYILPRGPWKCFWRVVGPTVRPRLTSRSRR